MLNTYKKGASMLCTKGAKPALLSSVSERCCFSESQVSSFPGDAVTCPVLFTGLVAVLEESYE